MFKHYTDKELLKETNSKSLEIRKHTLELLDLLTEVNSRKLYCSLSYSSLFKYITDELKFSESQAAIYNNIIKSKIIEMPQVKKQIQSGELSLFSAAEAGKEMRDNHITLPHERQEIINKNINQTRSQYKPKKKSNPTLEKKIELIKAKLNLSPEMQMEELLEFLIDDKLNQNQNLQTNKSITPKTKRLLKVQAKHQCEFVSSRGRCIETKYLEIDHRIPKALGGSNYPSNLRVFCREHNQYASQNHFGRRSYK